MRFMAVSPGIPCRIGPGLRRSLRRSAGRRCEPANTAGRLAWTAGQRPRRGSTPAPPSVSRRPETAFCDRRVRPRPRGNVVPLQHAPLRCGRVRVSAPAPALRPQPFAIPHQVQHEFAPVRPSPALAATGMWAGVSSAASSPCRRRPPQRAPPRRRRPVRHQGARRHHRGPPRRHHRRRLGDDRDKSSPGHAARLRNGADVAVALPTGSFFARHRR